MKNDGRNNKIAVALRAMTDADLTDIVSLEGKIFADPWPRSAFEDQLAVSDWHTLVAESRGRIIGYACFLIAAGECHLANIAVDPTCRRKSVANQLLDRILEVAAENRCESVFLEVRISNREAIGFYKRSGFEKLYHRPRYYSRPPEDALVMVRRLSAAPEDE